MRVPPTVLRPLLDKLHRNLPASTRQRLFPVIGQMRLQRSRGVPRAIYRREALLTISRLFLGLGAAQLALLWVYASQQVGGVSFQMPRPSVELTNRASLISVQDIQGVQDDLSEDLSTAVQMNLQMVDSRLSQFWGELSNLLQAINQTSDQIVQNMK